MTELPIIRACYIAVGEDLPELAERYGVDLAKLEAVARAEHWLIERIGFQLYTLYAESKLERD